LALPLAVNCLAFHNLIEHACKFGYARANDGDVNVVVELACTGRQVAVSRKINNLLMLASISGVTLRLESRDLLQEQLNVNKILEG